MIPNVKLIQALRKTANDIQKGDEYNWFSTKHCNCGLLARNLLTNVNKDKLEKTVIKSTGETWSEKVQIQREINEDIKCRETGLSMADILFLLNEAGVEDEDFEKLEFIELANQNDFELLLQKEEYLYVTDIPKRQAPWLYKTKVVKYFRDKANELEQMLSVPIPNRHKQVIITTIPVSISF